MVPEVRGHCDRRFERMAELFAGNFEQGLELGASLAVTLEGETVVDLWGGYQDVEKTRPWEEDTLTIVFSSTKFAKVNKNLIVSSLEHLTEAYRR